MNALSFLPHSLSLSQDKPSFRPNETHSPTYSSLKLRTSLTPNDWLYTLNSLLYLACFKVNIVNLVCSPVYSSNIKCLRVLTLEHPWTSPLHHWSWNQNNSSWLCADFMRKKMSGTIMFFCGKVSVFCCYCYLTCFCFLFWFGLFCFVFCFCFVFFYFSIFFCFFLYLSLFPK